MTARVRTAAIAALLCGGFAARAQEAEEPPLITPETLAGVRAEPLGSPGEVTATPGRLFLGHCVGNGEPERLTQVILHGLHRGEAGNVSMPAFRASMADAQVAGWSPSCRKRRPAPPLTSARMP